MRLLLVEDDPLLGEGIQRALSQDGYTVDWLKNGKQALQAMLQESFSAVILDLGLPDMDGLEVLQQARQQGVSTPVVILTARFQVENRVKGLDHGADDYLTKPFELEELEARIRAIIRRSQGRTQPLLTFHGLTLDPASNGVTLEGEEVELSLKEVSILRLLMEADGRVISRRHIEDQLYGWDKEVESNTMEVYIHKLRKKLGSSMIKTVRGIGYKLQWPQ